MLRERKLYREMLGELAAGPQMVFLSGPRQSGKTTLAKALAGGYATSVYANWDHFEHKRLILTRPAFFTETDRADRSRPLVVLDEIHKYPEWKNYLKGMYDQYAADYQFLISGSGRLDLFKRGGDSLAGRYFQLRLFPFTLAELQRQRRTFAEFTADPLRADPANSKTTREQWETLATVGGFPDPYLQGTKQYRTRWMRNYAAQLINEDIRSLADIRNSETVAMLFALLPERVGSPLSLNNLAQHLQVAYNSVKHWLQLFELTYLAFFLPPWTKKLARAISKERKAYLYCYPEIDNAAVRFENMVALELLRAVTNWNDRGWGNYALHYVRNREHQEVDFLIAERNRPLLLIEAKSADTTPAPALLKFQRELNVPGVQLVDQPGIWRNVAAPGPQTLIASAPDWLATLP